MSSALNPRSKELSDKENPPHPSPALKKLSSVEEAPSRKTVLGEATQHVVGEEPGEESDQDERLYRAKCEKQRSSKRDCEFVLRPINC